MQKKKKNVKKMQEKKEEQMDYLSKAKEIVDRIVHLAKDSKEVWKTVIS